MDEIHIYFYIYVLRGCVLVGHLHYSIDVFAAFFITYGIHDGQVPLFARASCVQTRVAAAGRACLAPAETIADQTADRARKPSRFDFFKKTSRAEIAVLDTRDGHDAPDAVLAAVENLGTASPDATAAYPPAGPR